MAPKRPRKVLPEPPKDPRQDLFDLLMEQSVPSTPEEWFSVPWNRAFNAIDLACALDGVLFGHRAARWEAAQFLHDCRLKELTSDTYWQAQTLKEGLSSENEDTSCLYAALHLLQKHISASDGGGQIYNSRLLALCEHHLAKGANSDVIEQLVMRYRMFDALHLHRFDYNPSDPKTIRRMQAFQTAWKQGLYRLAYQV